MTQSRAYYNEKEPYAVEWLRNLIAGGLIAPGDVDDRDIRDVRPGDLAGYTQCHFFAGIGVWSLALRRAGWSDDCRVWTGSCPCQPFSQAGRGAGFADERHLWPSWFHLISQQRPPIVFGEQVASKDGLDWLAVVHADLEAARYAFGAADLCAAGVGAPHIRQRLFFVADAPGARGGRDARSAVCGDGDGALRIGSPEPRRCRGAGRLGNALSPGLPQPQPQGVAGPWRWQQRRATGESGGSFWTDADWLYCRDDRWRPVEPGSFPLADGAPARVGRLRAYGNAIVPQAAQAFISAYLDLTS